MISPVRRSRTGFLALPQGWSTGAFPLIPQTPTPTAYVTVCTVATPVPGSDTGGRGSWHQRAQVLKRDARALLLAYRHPRVPRYARLWIALVVAYAFSPIDLVPDPVPILGQLDDLVLVPLGVALAIRMLPAEVWEECRHSAGEASDRPVSRAGALLIVGLWMLVASFIFRAAGHLL